MNHHWIQLAYQLADSICGGCYSFAGTCIICFILNLIPGLQLRTTENAEILGIDDAEIGEFAYDYVEITRELLSDIEGEANSRYSADAGASFDPREKNSIPLMDSRMYAGQQSQSPIPS